MNERYIVVEESLSCHCCFEATVIDTQDKGCDFSGRAICECLFKEDAYFIAKQLNDKLEVDTLLLKKYDS